MDKRPSMRSSRHERGVSRDTSSRGSYLEDDLLGDSRGQYSPVSEITQDTPDDQLQDLISLDLNDSKATLVIAIDFGTTNTGVAWSYQSTSRADIKKIEKITSWARTMSNMSKVPSVYSYSVAVNNELQWGSDLSDNAVAMINLKLELDVMTHVLDELELLLQLLDGTRNLSYEHIMRTGDEPEYTWKSPEAIVTDYMHEIFDAVYPSLGQFSRDERLRERTPVDLVVTVPVNWSYEARNSTLRAITKAGFDHNAFPALRDVIMVYEPEAAALYTARFYREIRKEDFLQADECFILVDAGGGTVDCVAYQVTQLNPVVQLKKVTSSTNDKCGATYINEEFKQWLRGYIGDRNYQHLDPNITDHRTSSQCTESGPLRRLMSQFEAEKRRFPHPNQKPACRLSLPEPLNRLTIAGKIRDGELVIPFEQMKKFFDPCVSKVIRLVAGQVQQIAKKANRRTKNVLLIGGFGESAYLRRELETSLTRKRLTLRRLDEDTAWTAVVCGACMYGIEKAQYRGLRLMYQSPRSYGIVIDEPSPTWKHDESDSDPDISTNSTVPVADHFAWLVRKGDLIMSDEPTILEKDFTVSWPEAAVKEFDLPVYTYPMDGNEEDDDVPERWQTGQFEVKTLGTVKGKMTRFPIGEYSEHQDPVTGQVTLKAALVCRMQMSSHDLTTIVLFNNIEVGRLKVKVDSVRS